MKIMAIVISESAAKKLSTESVVELDFVLNSNDVLLNLYGNFSEYKAFPDIGEFTKGGIVLGHRRLFKNSIYFDMSNVNLQRTFETDKVIYENGRVTDIKVYSNEDIEELEKYEYNSQIVHYLQLQEKYYTELIEVVEKYIDFENRNYSDDLAYYYNRAKSIMDEDSRWKSDNKDFQNVIVKITLTRDEPVVIGSKLSNRYGCNYSPSL